MESSGLVQASGQTRKHPPGSMRPRWFIPAVNQGDVQSSGPVHQAVVGDFQWRMSSVGRSNDFRLPSEINSNPDIIKNLQQYFPLS